MLHPSRGIQQSNFHSYTCWWLACIADFAREDCLWDNACWCFSLHLSAWHGLLFTVTRTPDIRVYFPVEEMSILIMYGSHSAQLSPHTCCDVSTSTRPCTHDGLRFPTFEERIAYGTARVDVFPRICLLFTVTHMFDICYCSFRNGDVSWDGVPERECRCTGVATHAEGALFALSCWRWFLEVFTCRQHFLLFCFVERMSIGTESQRECRCTMLTLLPCRVSFVVLPHIQRYNVYAFVAAGASAERL